MLVNDLASERMQALVEKLRVRGSFESVSLMTHPTADAVIYRCHKNEHVSGGAVLPIPVLYRDSDDEIIENLMNQLFPTYRRRK